MSFNVSDTSLLRTALGGPIVRNALQVSFVVGTALNLVNQSGVYLHGAPISWPHLAMNYVIPYCVASYSAAKNELQARRRRPE